MARLQVCVVGGCGYLGQRLVQRLVAYDCNVVVLDVAELPEILDANPHVRHVRGDIRQFDAVFSAFQGVQLEREGERRGGRAGSRQDRDKKRQGRKTGRTGQVRVRLREAMVRNKAHAAASLSHTCTHMHTRALTNLVQVVRLCFTLLLSWTCLLPPRTWWARSTWMGPPMSSRLLRPRRASPLSSTPRALQLELFSTEWQQGGGGGGR